MTTDPLQPIKDVRESLREDILELETILMDYPTGSKEYKLENAVRCEILNRLVPALAEAEENVRQLELSLTIGMEQPTRPDPGRLEIAMCWVAGVGCHPSQINDLDTYLATADALIAAHRKQEAENND